MSLNYLVNHIRDKINSVNATVIFSFFRHGPVKKVKVTNVKYVYWC